MFHFQNSVLSNMLLSQVGDERIVRAVAAINVEARKCQPSPAALRVQRSSLPPEPPVMDFGHTAAVPNAGRRSKPRGHVMHSPNSKTCFGRFGGQFVESDFAWEGEAPEDRQEVTP